MSETAPEDLQGQQEQVHQFEQKSLELVEPSRTSAEASNSVVTSFDELIQRQVDQLWSGSHIFVASLLSIYLCHWLFAQSLDSWGTMIFRLIFVYPMISTVLTVILMHSTHATHLARYKRNVKAELQRQFFTERLITHNPLDREVFVLTEGSLSSL
jgi:uncharacterized membrane protein